MLKPDTPFAIAAEIYAITFGGPVVVLLVLVTTLMMLRWWRPVTTAAGFGKAGVTAGAVIVSVILAYGFAALGALSTLQDPRYSAFMVCDPCF